jgi:hypothetical protein
VNTFGVNVLLSLANFHQENDCQLIINEPCELGAKTRQHSTMIYEFVTSKRTELPTEPKGIRGAVVEFHRSPHLPT